MGLLLRPSEKVLSGIHWKYLVSKAKSSLLSSFITLPGLLFGNTKTGVVDGPKICQLLDYIRRIVELPENVGLQG